MWKHFNLQTRLLYALSGGKWEIGFGENINSLVEDSSPMLFKLVTGNLGFNLWFSIKKKNQKETHKERAPRKLVLLET